MSEPNSKERKRRIREVQEEIESMNPKRTEELIQKFKRRREEREEAFYLQEEMLKGVEEEKKKSVDAQKHVGMVTKLDMITHIYEIRKEIDSKFVSYLMTTGLTRAEAMKEVRVWNAERNW